MRQQQDRHNLALSGTVLVTPNQRRLRNPFASPSGKGRRQCSPSSLTIVILSSLLFSFQLEVGDFIEDIPRATATHPSQSKEHIHNKRLATSSPPTSTARCVREVLLIFSHSHTYILISSHSHITCLIDWGDLRGGCCADYFETKD